MIIAIYRGTYIHSPCFLFVFVFLQHIGQVVDFGNLTGGFKSLLTKLKRPALKWLKNQAIDKVKELIPDDSLLAPFKNLSLTFLHNINTNASNLKNLFTPGWLVTDWPWLIDFLIDLSIDLFVHLCNCQVRLTQLQSIIKIFVRGFIQILVGLLF